MVQEWPSIAGINCIRSGLPLHDQHVAVQNITVDPTDPQKFFQDNDNTFNVRPTTPLAFSSALRTRTAFCASFAACPASLSADSCKTLHVCTNMFVH